MCIWYNKNVGKSENKKGFSLLELLAVLVIMAALAVIAVPIFMNKGDEAKQTADKANREILIKQAQKYLWEVASPIDPTNIIPEMVAAGYLKEIPKYPINNLNTYAVEIVDGQPEVKLNGPVVPTLEITASTPDTTSETNITYTFTFLSSVTGFDTNDITVTNGTKGDFVGNGAVYTLVVTGELGQTQTVSVADGVATSTVGGLANIGATKSILIAKTGADIQEGQYIKFGKYKAKDNSVTDIIWRVIHKVTAQDLIDDPTSGLHEGDLMLLSDKIITLKPYDANGDATDGRDDGGSNRTLYGSNYWEKSNIRDWLNSAAAEGGVVWTCFAPTNARVWGNYNDYDQEKGFLADGNFTETERDQMVPITHKAMISDIDVGIKDGGTTDGHDYSYADPSVAVRDYDTANYKNTTDKVFLLGIKELNDYVYTNVTLGDGTTWYRAKLTSQAVTNSEYGPLNTASYWYYLLRDSYSPNSFRVRSIYTDGSVNDVADAYNGLYGVRPACILSSSSMTLDGASGATAATAYTILSFN